ncbi:glycosyl transferase family 2 [candidate division Kazan bacterium RIFCSPLOWO2_01_FULL_48_13]|uniref:Glycosyl transferase family 2 n=1 Tax=candidate division Kazan bacterium RIFCSPLOWO2_01_FULL_48_13 TaxID=1798539 RepID=A0A1F4PQ22_UNCK3|nr:MAG: glycosyl transferase family 2 [candidate division Kazan bacterium RIFCSPLOWO2_01_FULL_48_13]
MKLSIVVPCYNEAQNIPLILERFQSAIRRNDIEVILVDNNSVDGSDKVLAELVPRYAFARSLSEPSPGYGHAVVAGLKIAHGEYIGWTHADMQTDPKDPIRALGMIENLGNPTNIYLKGRRLSRPWLDTILTWGMSVFETLYLGRVLFDINAQPNIFHKNFFAAWQNPPGDFALDLYALYLAKKVGIHIIRFDVTFLKRVYGESSWNKGLASRWKFIKRTIKFSVGLKRRLAL